MREIDREPHVDAVASETVRPRRADDEAAAPRLEEISRRVLFELARQRYEQASSVMATSEEVKVDEQMLADDEMVVVSSPVV